MSFSKNSVRTTMKCMSGTEREERCAAIKRGVSERVDPTATLSHSHKIRDMEVWRWGEKTVSVVVAFASLKMCGVHTLGSTLMPYLKYIQN